MLAMVQGRLHDPTADPAEIGRYARVDHQAEGHHYEADVRHGFGPRAEQQAGQGGPDHGGEHGGMGASGGQDGEVLGRMVEAVQRPERLRMVQPVAPVVEQ